MIARLEIGFDFGANNELIFKTTVIELGDGSEQRLAHYQAPLAQIQFGDRNLSTHQMHQSFQYLQQFFRERKGSQETFAVRTWDDYEAHLQPCRRLTATTYLLEKEYGDLATPVRLPILSKLEIFVNGTKLVGGYSVDASEGVITFATARATTDVVTWSGEFDRLCRFAEDKLEVRNLGYSPDMDVHILQISSLRAREVPNKYQPRIVPPKLFCFDYIVYQTSPDQPWQTMQVEETNLTYRVEEIIEPVYPFRGGQCQGVDYIIRVVATLRRVAGNVIIVQIDQAKVIKGKITYIGYFSANGYSSLGAKNNNNQAVDHYSSTRALYPPDYTLDSVNIATSPFQATITRADGQPDNCGDPEPTGYEVVGYKMTVLDSLGNTRLVIDNIPSEPKIIKRSTCDETKCYQYVEYRLNGSSSWVTLQQENTNLTYRLITIPIPGRCSGVPYNATSQAVFRLESHISGVDPVTVTVIYSYSNVPGTLSNFSLSPQGGFTFGGNTRAPQTTLKGFTGTHTSNSANQQPTGNPWWNQYTNNTTLSHALTSMSRVDGQPDNCENTYKLEVLDSNNNVIETVDNLSQPPEIRYRNTCEVTQ